LKPQYNGETLHQGEGSTVNKTKNNKDGTEEGKERTMRSTNHHIKQNKNVEIAFTCEKLLSQG